MKDHLTTFPTPSSSDQFIVSSPEAVQYQSPPRTDSKKFAVWTLVFNLLIGFVWWSGMDLVPTAESSKFFVTLLSLPFAFLMSGFAIVAILTLTVVGTFGSVRWLLGATDRWSRIEASAVLALHSIAVWMGVMLYLDL